MDNLYKQELSCKEALKKIVIAVEIFTPLIDTNSDYNNKLVLIAKLPKVMKIIKENENELKQVFNKEFLENIKTLTQ